MSGTNEYEPDPEGLRVATRELSIDKTSAFRMFQQLAEQGSVAGAVTLADLFCQGIEGKPDTAAAERWLRRASEGGSTRASYRLGKLYMDIGQYARAYEVLSSESCREYAPAQLMLAEIYLRGIAIPKNTDRALALLESAAAQGNAYAKGRLAQLYIHGLHIQGAGCFLCGLRHPRRFLRGIRLWLSGFGDALFCNSESERVQI